eukprot:531992_1
MAPEVGRGAGGALGNGVDMSPARGGFMAPEVVRGAGGAQGNGFFGADMGRAPHSGNGGQGYGFLSAEMGRGAQRGGGDQGYGVGLSSAEDDDLLAELLEESGDDFGQGP